MIDLNDVQPAGTDTGPTAPSFAEICERLGERVEDVARALLGEPNRELSTRAQWRYGTHGSLAIEITGDKRGQWYDHENSVGGGVLDLVKHHTGLSNGEAVKWIGSQIGIELEPAPRRQQRRRIVATYDYHDENGALLFQVVRFEPKDFRQRRPDGTGGWTWSVKGVRQVPYRLFELSRRAPSDPVLIVEGEKDVDRLAALGFVATCNAGGAGKWNSGLDRYLRDKSVYIIPDNDDSGRRHAQQVAASLESVAASIAIVELPELPPKGDVCHWLDHGGDIAVLVRLCQAAPPWKPGDPLDDSRVLPSVQEEELGAVAATYPLPPMDTMRLAYLPTRAGEIKVHKHVGKDKHGRETWLPLASPFGIPARLRYADQADAYGLRVTVRDMQGSPRVVDFERAALAKMAASDIRAALYAAGLRTEGEGEVVALSALKAASPAKEIAVVSRPGWHRIDGGTEPMFFAPSGDVIGEADTLSEELAAHARLAEPVVSGTLDGWRQAVSAAISTTGCPHWLVGVMAGFAGPVLCLAGLDTCGINFSGLSSSGKSTAQKLAVSAWSSAALGAGLLQSMRTTENALETLAQTSSGTVLALDEMAHADGRAVSRMIYSIAGGQGKLRMTANATLKGRYAWSTYAVLSGECSLEEKVRGDGGHWLAGMAVRIADIDVTDVDRSVDQDRLDAIAAIGQHFGQAGPTFVRGLIDAGLAGNPEALRHRVLRTARDIAGEGADGARIRAAICFALPLLAGELATAFGILPADAPTREAIDWAWQRFGASSDAAPLEPAEQAIVSLRAWIAERWDVTIKSVDAAVGGFDHSSRLNNREAVAWYDDETVYVPVRRIREAAGDVLKEQQIAKFLDASGLLARRHDAKRIALRSIPKVGKVDCYALRRAEFGRSYFRDRSFSVYDGDLS